MPAVPSCILDPLREQFLALLPPHVDEHPLACHRPRIDDAVVFDKLVEALVFGAGYERIAGAACSATTLRHHPAPPPGRMDPVGRLRPAAAGRA